MKYLLDTNILVDHIRGRKAITEDILKDGAGISIITLGELIYGAYKSDNPEDSLAKLDYIINRLNLQTEDLNEIIMYTFGDIKASLEKKGQRLEDFDLLIGATAKVNKLILVTRNLKHFKRIKGLKLLSIREGA